MDTGTDRTAAGQADSRHRSARMLIGGVPGHSHGGVKQGGVGREFSLAGMLDSFTRCKSVTVNLATPPRRAG